MHPLAIDDRVIFCDGRGGRARCQEKAGARGTNRDESVEKREKTGNSMNFISTHHAALSGSIRVDLVMMQPCQSIRGHALAHEHACPGRSLEDVVNALDPERGALFVRACADGSRNELGLCACDVFDDVRGRVRGT
jgi:hypothetical protein